MTDASTCLSQLWSAANEAMRAVYKTHATEAQLTTLSRRKSEHIRYSTDDGRVSDCGGRYFSRHEQNVIGTKPRIELYCAPPPAELDKPRADPGTATADVVTLAHEFGHFRSDEAGHFSQDYLGARDLANAFERGLGKRPSAHQARLVYAEELRAWRFAHESLARLGFEDWLGFTNRRAANLRSYVDGLGIRGLVKERM